jgi:hypothetical protein
MDTPLNLTAKELSVHYGKALARLRKRKGMTQGAASALIDSPQGTWSRYEVAANQAFLDIGTQQKCVVALGFTLNDLALAFDDVAHGRPPSNANSATLPPLEPSRQSAPELTFPLDGIVKLGEAGMSLVEDAESDAYDFAPLLNKYMRVLRIADESMLPLVEPGGFVTYLTKGIPRRNSLCVLRFKSGEYLVRKFIRQTPTRVECVQMDSQIVNNHPAYVETPVLYFSENIAGLYPVSMRID